MSVEQNAMEKYQAWLEDPLIDDETKQELRSIIDDPDEIEDRFYKNLAFGTGGLRGIMGAGTNRMNPYVVGKATQGLADWLKQKAKAAHPSSAASGHGSTDRQLSVAIAYDSRHRSPEFAQEVAAVLAGNGIKAYLFESLRPTPELSFAVRHLQADAGIVVTASHNPPAYNGYKVYGDDGGQLVPADARAVIDCVNAVGSLADVARMDIEEAKRQGLLSVIGDEVDQAYLKALKAVSLHPQAASELGDAFRVVYTPLHGSGNRPVQLALAAIGCRQVHIVAEQEQPDGDFPTVKSPNPEERDAFEMALALAADIDADIVLGTDPDCDRMGAIVRTSGGAYEQLTGNQTGAILLYYVLESLRERDELPANGAMIKTIVTGELGARIAEDYGLTVFNTLTGFKYIGEKMSLFEQTGEYTFLFGYEESYGYLAGDHCRDKDAVVSSMLLCEAAAWFKLQGRTLVDVLHELYERYGCHQETLHSRTMAGKEGMDRIRSIMDYWRKTPPQQAAGVNVRKVSDYLQGLDGLPKENVLKFELEDGSWFCLRPSGTEPKIKVYVAVCQPDLASAQEGMKRLSDDVMGRLEPQG